MNRCQGREVLGLDEAAIFVTHPKVNHCTQFHGPSGKVNENGSQQHWGVQTIKWESLGVGSRQR